MPSLFSRMRGKDGQAKLKSKKNANFDGHEDQSAAKPRWEDAYTRNTVEPEEIEELVRLCTKELKARALDHPFLVLPFRPTSNPSAVRTFIRHFFDDGQNLRGEALAQDLRMVEPMVIAGVLKWCWSRLPGGVVGWDAYELFKVGEQDSNMARDAFTTFIPLSVENEARSHIITSFFELLAAMAAHGKKNGLGGRKLSRMGAWWAFEHKDTGNGFEGGYKTWLSAADATSHLFFAYLRSLAPQPTVGGISMLPMSLQKLLQETEYPPQRPSLMQTTTNKVVMIVDTVSPTPFALLRRAKHFQYRDDDRALAEFSEYEDPVKALSEECRRVLRAISLANQSQASSAKHSTGLRDASWSRFEDIGFAGALDDDDDEEEAPKTVSNQHTQGLRTAPASGTTNLGRPTTPSWADFLSSGFVDETGGTANVLLPPDKILPPIDAGVRQRSAQSHRPRLETSNELEPGELASITRFDLDEAFWWVWMSSLAPEETPERKSAFGRCAVVETVIRSGRWLVMEEMVKGAAPEPDAGAYIAEKKGFFSWGRKNKDKGVARRKSTGKQNGKGSRLKPDTADTASKTSVGDQHARIHAAAQQLQARQAEQQMRPVPLGRRGRTDSELIREKTNSVLTLQPVIMKEASPAMKWANKYDKDTIREAYLSNTSAGRGLGQATMQTNGHSETNDDDSYAVRSPGYSETSGSTMTMEPQTPATIPEQRLETLPESEPSMETPRDQSPAIKAESVTGRDSPLPPLPPAAKQSMDIGRENMMSPEPTSPDSKKQHKKLHKEEKKTGGFRKLFSRRNRASRVPDNAGKNLNAMLAQHETHETADSRADSALANHQDDTPTPTAPTAPTPEPAYEPSLDDTVSRIDTADDAHAQQEFSRFDQGPLADQPAFVPEDDVSEDDAAPPPIARHATPSPPDTPAPEDDDDDSAPSPAVPMQDRWAQIRKNAADRARQSEESRGGQSKTTDDDDNTSTEETIESRVARIKARVAELTGNMEGTTAPDNRVPPSRR